MLRDPNYLQNVAYSDASKLGARVAFWRKYGGGGRAQYGGGLIDGMSLPPGAKILEVGCGTGELWNILGDDIRADWQITLTDLSQGMLSDTEARLSELLPSADFRVADVRDLPFDANSFDVVIANYMLYHLPDVAAGIAEIARVLQPTGTLYSSTNGARHLQEVSEAQQRFSLDTVETDDTIGHTSAFALENGGELLGRSFADVTSHQHDDTIEVDKTDDLMSYLQSMAAAMDMDSLRAHIDGVIDRDGAFEITRSTGYFTASKPIGT